ncbi:MAG: SDR family NAD(P)-dependent oxidoreductase, partial [Bacteroidales bacterium]
MLPDAEGYIALQEKKIMSDYAIITGAAGGLGKAYAFELAKRGYNTILIDLPDKGLDQICSAIEAQ